MRFEKDDSFKQLMKFRLITPKKKKNEISIRNQKFNKRGLHSSSSEEVQLQLNKQYNTNKLVNK